MERGLAAPDPDRRLQVAGHGTVFFGLVGADWSQPNVQDAVEHAAWVAIGGYALSAAASLLLPKRALVQKHAEEQAKLLALP